MGGRFKGDTKDPAVNVTTWVLMVTIILSVTVRLGTKWRLFHKLTADDVLIVTSMVGFARGDLWARRSNILTRGPQAFSIAQSIMVNLAVGSGYGKPFKDVSSDQFEDVMKVGRSSWTWEYFSYQG
jgi:hypothetical protein